MEDDSLKARRCCRMAERKNRTVDPILRLKHLAVLFFDMPFSLDLAISRGLVAGLKTSSSRDSDFSQS